MVSGNWLLRSVLINHQPKLCYMLKYISLFLYFNIKYGFLCNYCNLRVATLIAYLVLSIYSATINLIQIVISFIYKKDAICCIHDPALVKLWRFILLHSLTKMYYDI